MGNSNACGCPAARALLRDLQRALSEAYKELWRARVPCCASPVESTIVDFEIARFEGSPQNVRPDSQGDV